VALNRTLRGLACLAAVALGLAGCDDRRAGTEVGNPEVTMTVVAKFSVFDNNQEVNLRSLYVNVMGMKYAWADSVAGNGMRQDSGRCWFSPGGTLSNLAEWQGVPLQPTSVKAATWTRVETILRTPEGPSRLPDSAGFDSWSDPRHAKFYLVRNADTLRALFEMPPGREIHLLFSQKSIQLWYWAPQMWVPFNFNAGTWAGVLDSRGPWTMRQDGKHRPYVLFSPTENAAAWSDLEARFPFSFVADTIQVR
jgi:hypothetical protein